MSVMKIVSFLQLLLLPAMLLAADYAPPKSAGGEVLVLFTDTTVYRRTLDSAPKIGEGNEDYRVHIGCMGKADCIGKISRIYNLITRNKGEVASCKSPIYARVELKPDMISYGESNENVVEAYNIDYTGKCVTHGGSSYRIDQSVFEIFNTVPIPAWGKTNGADQSDQSR